MVVNSEQNERESSEAHLSEVASGAARFYVSINWRKAGKRDTERQSKPPEQKC
jgi:hypothetical protein